MLKDHKNDLKKKMRELEDERIKDIQRIHAQYQNEIIKIESY